MTNDVGTPVFVIDLGIGWMRWPDGRMESAAPFEYVREIERLEKALTAALQGACRSDAMRAADEPCPSPSGVDFDKDLARLDGVRNTMRDMQRYSLQGVPQGEVMFLLSFIDNLWREYSRTSTNLSLGWQPIETCPKNGAAFLAGRWNREKTYWWVHRVHWANGVVDGGWDGAREMIEVPCTHWMPVPAPPRAEQSRS